MSSVTSTLAARRTSARPTTPAPSIRLVQPPHEFVLEQTDSVPPEYGRWIDARKRGSAQTRIMHLERRLKLRLRLNCCVEGGVGNCLVEQRFADGSVHRYIFGADCVRAVYGV